MGSEENTSQSSSYNKSLPSTHLEKQGIKLHKWLLKKLMAKTGLPPFCIRLWDGTQVSAPDPEYTVQINSKSAFYKLMFDPELYFGETYVSGELVIEGDIIKLLEIIFINRSNTKASTSGFTRKLLGTLINPVRNNNLKGSKQNIYHHYDIGNDFYELWLDKEAMQYTCAYYPTENETLEQAQIAKLDHICRKLQLKPGDTVVEAGCGWGGLARHMAKHYGANVRSYNISHQQIVYAREKAKQQAVDHLVEYIEDDYRTINGEYDVFVSVGMLEHVGISHFATLGEVIQRSLKKNGRGLIHSIGRNQPGKMNSWIQKRIFPGAETPSLSQISSIFENQLSVLDIENIRLHYAKTLRHWLERFNDNEERIRTIFDEEFVRIWKLYLSGSIAAFSSGQLQLFQIIFTHNRRNDIPMTREYIYN